MIPILVKVMTSVAEERPRLVVASYGQHRSQLVNVIDFYTLCPKLRYPGHGGFL